MYGHESERHHGRVECSGSKRGRVAFPPGEARKPCHIGGGLYEQAGPGLRSCSESTDGGKTTLPPPPQPALFTPLQAPSKVIATFPELPWIVFMSFKRTN